jgi:hypothetical protein
MIIFIYQNAHSHCDPRHGNVLSNTGVPGGGRASFNGSVFSVMSLMLLFSAQPYI